MVLQWGKQKNAIFKGDGGLSIFIDIRAHDADLQHADRHALPDEAKGASLGHRPGQLTREIGDAMAHAG